MLKQREINTVFGKTGMGKTAWSKRYLAGKNRVIILDPLLEYEGVYFESMERMIDYIQAHSTFQVKTDSIREFESLCLIAHAAKGCILVIEEAQRIIPPRSILPSQFEDLIYRGRHSGTSIHVISQRPSTVNIALRSQFTRLITFNQTESADIDWIQQVTGFDVEPGKLARLEYYDITPQSYEVKKLDLTKDLL